MKTAQLLNDIRRLYITTLIQYFNNAKTNNTTLKASYCSDGSDLDNPDQFEAIVVEVTDEHVVIKDEDDNINITIYYDEIDIWSVSDEGFFY